MRSYSSASLRQHGVAAKAAIACMCACFSWSTVVQAEPSDLPPEVGYNYDEVETARIIGKNGADRALGSSVSALFNNPANMAAARVYHASAFAQIWPEAKRQSYGAAAVDSVSSSTRVSGGVGATWNRQDPNGVDRTATDLRFALAYPFSERFFLGAGGRFMWLTQNGDGDLGGSYASGGLAREQIVKSIVFDAGLTVKPGGGLSLALVGNNLGEGDSGFQPLSIGGGIGFARDILGIEADLVSDFVTWQETKLRFMLGSEVLVGDHVVVRGGYRYDQGAVSHSGSLGVGYIDRAFSIDLGARHVLAGDRATAVVLSLNYHVESTGLTPTQSETF
ncbi:MAG TPA: hypothetical protein VIW29_17770 [Polyangiaceae bacterium]